MCSSAGCTHPKRANAKTHPMDYFVPNFGKDADVNHTWNSLDWAEKNLKHKFNPVLKGDTPDGPPMNYPVPNFGQDSDIAATQASIATEEKRQNVKWVPEQDDNGVWMVPEAANNKSYSYKSLVQLESDPICPSSGCTHPKRADAATHPMDYFVPNFGRDENVNHTWNSLDWAEKNLKHKFDPVLKGDAPDGPPMNYPVPNFGQDEDVKSTLDHVSKAEKKLDHKWVPVQDENGVWMVPEPINNKAYTYKGSLVQLDSEVETESDPICSSAGCTHPKRANAATHPMDYFVPNFGKDENVKHTWSSLDWAEKSLKHKFNPTLKGDTPDGPPKDYFVPDFGLEEDVVDTLANIKKTEVKQKREWNPV